MKHLILYIVCLCYVYQLELVFWLLVNPQFMYLQYNMYLFKPCIHCTQVPETSFDVLFLEQITAIDLCWSSRNCKSFCNLFLELQYKSIAVICSRNKMSKEVSGICVQCMQGLKHCSAHTQHVIQNIPPAGM